MKAKTPYQMVREFHEAMGHPLDLQIDFQNESNNSPETDEVLELRAALIEEEVNEMMNAENAENWIKEACDLVYVLCGTFAVMGIDFDEAFRRVHESNMSKLGDDGKPVRREDGKIMKGPNYQPPVLDDLLKPRVVN